MRSTRSLVSLLIALLTSCRTSIAWLPTSGVVHRTSHGLQTSSRNQFQGQSLFDRNAPGRPATTARQRSLSLLRAVEVSTDLPPPVFMEPEPPNNNDNELSELSLQQKILNGLFLATAFGYCLYEVLNIDHGMTRGWTGSEIAMRIPLDNWGTYESSLANQPIFTKTLINVIIYLLGDWLSQTAFQGKNVLEFDIARTLRNGFIGLCFGPLVHEYYQFSDSILPPDDGMVVRLQKIFMDQTVYLAIKCSMYISAVGLLGGEDWDTVQQRVKDKLGGIMITAWKFWPLVHCVTYGLIPARHRILWVSSVDLVWNAILASQAQKDDPAEEGDAPQEDTQQPLLLLESSSQDTEDAVPDLSHENTTNAHHQPHVVVLDNHEWVEAEIVTSQSHGINNTTAEGQTPVAA